MTRVLNAFALVVALSLGASADEVIFDRWSEEFVGYQKMGYQHHKLVKTDTGYLEHITSWWFTAEGAVVSKTRIEMDAKCALVRREKTESGGLGTVTEVVKATKDGLAWTVKVFGQPKLEGAIKGAVFDSGTVAVQMARGERKAEDVTLRVLDIPKGTKEKKVTVTQIEGSLHFESKESIRVYNGKGMPLQQIQTDGQGTEDQTVSEAEAKDMSRSFKGKRYPGVEPGKVNAGGLAATSPGKGWAMMYIAPDEDAAPHMKGGGMFMAHPYRVLLIAVQVPIPLPEDEAARTQLAKAMEQGFNERAPDMKYSGGKGATGFGLPGVVYQIEGAFEETLVNGECWFLRRSADAALMVMVCYPQKSGNEEAVKELFGKAKASFKATALKAKPAGKPQTVAFDGGLSLKLPSTWSKDADDASSWKSPGGSLIRAWVTVVPDDGESVARSWVGSLEKKFKVKATPIKETSLGGRKTFSSSMVTSANNLKMTLQLMIVPGQDGKHQFVLGVETQLEKATTLDKIFETATWKK